MFLLPIQSHFVVKISDIFAQIDKKIRPFFARISGKKSVYGVFAPQARANCTLCDYNAPKLRGSPFWG